MFPEASLLVFATISLGSSQVGLGDCRARMFAVPAPSGFHVVAMLIAVVASIGMSAMGAYSIRRGGPGSGGPGPEGEERSSYRGWRHECG